MRAVQSERQLAANEPLIGALLDALDAAAAARQRFALIVCYPQKIEDEDVRDLLRAAEPALREVLRAEDLSGCLSSDLLVVGLTGPEPDTVRALAFRLKSDLRLHTAHVRPAVWEAGFATMPEDGGTLEELLTKALQVAKHVRVPA